MASPIDSLAQYFATDLAIGALSTAVFEEHMPDSPDTCVAIYDTGGAPPALTQSDDTDYPGFQIRSRALDAGVALSNLLTIYQALHGVVEQDIHGTHFKLIAFKQSNPVSLGRDEKKRFEFVINLSAMVRGVTR